MRRHRRILPFVGAALLGVAIAAHSTRTKLEPAHAGVSVTTAHENASAEPGEVLIADRLGRLHRASARRHDTIAHPSTTLFVSQGAIVLLTGEVLVAGMEGGIEEENGAEGSSGARRSRLRPARRDMVRRAAELAVWRSTLGLSTPLPSHDRIALNRITQAALVKLDALDVKGTLSHTARTGRFAGKSFDEFQDVLEKLALITSSIRSDVIMEDFQMKSSTEASAHYVLAMDLEPKTGLVPTVRLAGAGRIQYKKYGRQWMVEGAELDVFNIDSEFLPEDFMELKDLVVGKSR